MSGYNHEPLRKEEYLSSVFSVNTNIDTIWELPISTFKNKAMVLGGRKTDAKTNYPLAGRYYEDVEQYEVCEYTLNKQGKRSAWTNKGADEEVVNLINTEPWTFNQGADIFPRTALFHKFTKLTNGSWKIEKIDKSSELFYLINDSKKNICNDIEVDGFDDQYMYDCFISKHLSPFIVWVSFCKGSKDGAYIEPDSGTLNSRRKKLQAILRNMSSYDEYEKACNIVMGIEE